MKIAAFDIETTDLKAGIGHMLCASICPIVDNKSGRSKPYSYWLAEEDFKIDSTIDKDLAYNIREELNKYNCIVTWNGKMFDVPFLNARLMKHGLDPFHPQFHLDAMYYAGGISMRIGSRKLASVQQFFDIKEKKIPLEWAEWRKASRGDDEAMKKVIKHCELDTIVLCKAYWKLLPLVSKLHR